jgi:hypothetical protein
VAPVVDIVTEDDPIAAPHICIRCSAESVLSVVGHCADCVSDMGLRHPDEYAEFRAEVSRQYGRK